MEKTYPELFKGLSDKKKEKVNEYIDSLYKKQKAGQEKQDTRCIKDPALLCAGRRRA